MEKLIVLDTECYPNYWLISFKSLSNGKVVLIDTKSKLTSEQKIQLKRIMSNQVTFGFNSIHYDLPMIQAALNDYDVKMLYKLSKKIVNGQPYFVTYKQMGVVPPNYNHFDIKEPAPAVMISLKNYGTRVGSKKLWDLPYDPNKSITDSEIDNLKAYCENDLDTTIDLYNAIKDRIQLRIDMQNEMYKGIGDLRSKSDAQVAEAIFKFELAKKNVKIPYVEASKRLKSSVTYTCPDFIVFKSDELNKLRDMFDGATFKINQGTGQPILPKEWGKLLKPTIDGTVYKLGLGGIHSQEKRLAIESNDKFVLRNADVASYYPSMILEFGLYPKSLGKKWLDIYRNVYITRLEAKRKASELSKEIKKLEKQLGNMV